MKTIFTVIFFLIPLISFDLAEFQPIRDSYVSPNQLYLSKNSKQLYIGLSTYPGVAIFSPQSGKVLRIIPMPTPVEGVLVDEKAEILYTSAGKHAAELYAYDLKANKTLNNVQVGHGPSDLAISHSLNQLFVANRFSNDIAVVDLAKRKVIGRIPVIREPVALAISPDERLLAVANLLPDQPSISRHVAAKITIIDAKKATVVKHVELKNGAYAVKDILFSDNGKFVYATHLLGRYNLPTNQIERGWINTNAVSILSVDELDLYNTVLLDDILRGAANPQGLSLSEDGKKLLVAISGTHEFFVIDRIKMHQQIEESLQVTGSNQTTYALDGASDDKIQVYQSSSELQPMQVLFEEIPNELSFLRPARQRIPMKGKGPAHIEVYNGKAFITSYYSDGLEIIDLSDLSGEPTFIPLGTKDLSASVERKGEFLFLDAESCFQQWQSCASCHPGEGRVDGLNWDLLNDGIGNPKNTKSLLFAHATPPTTAMGIREDAEASVRAGFKHIQFFDIPENDAAAVDLYLKSLRPVSSPQLVNGSLSESAKRGENIFIQNNCNLCHAGQYYTNLKQYELTNPSSPNEKTRLDTPTLIELWRTAPYLHDGSYSRLEDVFTEARHGLDRDLTEEEIQELVAYLLSL